VSLTEPPRTKGEAAGRMGGRAGRLGQGARNARSGRNRHFGLRVKYSVSILGRQGRVDRLWPRSVSATNLPHLHQRVVVSGDV